MKFTEQATTPTEARTQRLGFVVALAKFVAPDYVYNDDKVISVPYGHVAVQKMIYLLGEIDDPDVHALFDSLCIPHFQMSATGPYSAILAKEVVAINDNAEMFREVELSEQGKFSALWLKILSTPPTADEIGAVISQRDWLTMLAAYRYLSEFRPDSEIQLFVEKLIPETSGLNWVVYVKNIMFGCLKNRIQPIVWLGADSAN